jgi:hypothetical protein
MREGKGVCQGGGQQAQRLGKPFTPLQGQRLLYALYQGLRSSQFTALNGPLGALLTEGRLLLLIHKVA